MKQGKIVSLCLEEFDFWDGNIPAPLKLAGGARFANAAHHFWDGNIPAPLKLCGRPLGFCEPTNFWDGNIPAPLKQA